MNTIGTIIERKYCHVHGTTTHVNDACRPCLAYEQAAVSEAALKKREQFKQMPLERKLLYLYDAIFSEVE